MPFKCKKTSLQQFDKSPHVYEFEGKGEWEAFVENYELRGLHGCLFERVSPTEFIFITSNASHCTFVRTDV